MLTAFQRIGKNTHGWLELLTSICVMDNLILYCTVKLPGRIYLEERDLFGFDMVRVYIDKSVKKLPIKSKISLLKTSGCLIQVKRYCS